MSAARESEAATLREEVSRLRGVVNEALSVGRELAEHLGYSYQPGGEAYDSALLAFREIITKLASLGAASERIDGGQAATDSRPEGEK